MDIISLCSHLWMAYIGDTVSKTAGNSDRRRNLTVLALATLGNATQIGLFLFMSCRPRWPRQVSDCRVSLSLSPALSRNFCQCKYGFTFQALHKIFWSSKWTNVLAYFAKNWLKNWLASRFSTGRRLTASSVPSGLRHIRSYPPSGDVIKLFFLRHTVGKMLQKVLKIVFNLHMYYIKMFNGATKWYV